MTTDTDTNLKTLRHEVADLRADLSNIAETLKSLTVNGPLNAASRAQDSVEKLHDAIKSKLSGLTHEIEEQPVAATFTSFAVGVVLGALFGGRR